MYLVYSRHQFVYIYHEDVTHYKQLQTNIITLQPRIRPSLSLFSTSTGIIRVRNSLSPISQAHTNDQRQYQEWHPGPQNACRICIFTHEEEPDGHSNHTPT